MLRNPHTAGLAIACALLAALSGCEERAAPKEPVGVMLTASGPWDVEQGATAIYEFSLESQGDFVTRIQFENLPEGVTALAAPSGASTSVWRVELSAAWTALPASRFVEIRAFHGSATALATVQVVVSRAPPLSVRMMSPAPESWTRADVRVAVEVEGTGAEQVAVLLNGEVWRQGAAPFEAVLETAALAEGKYEISARAVRAGTTFAADRTAIVHVDRTPPVMLAKAPTGQRVSVRPPALQVAYTEPVLLTGAPAAAQSTPAGVELINLQVGKDGHSPQAVFAELVGVKAGMQVEVTIDGVVDRAGNPATAVSWSWAYAQWQRMEPDPLNPSEMNPSYRDAYLFSNSAADLFVAWSADHLPPLGGQKTYVARADGWAWKFLGAPFNYGLNHAAAGTQGQPLMIIHSILPRQWDGTTWTDLGSLTSLIGTGADVSGVRVGLDHLGAPTVAARTRDAFAPALRVVHLTATGWTRTMNDVVPVGTDRSVLFIGATAGGGETLAAFHVDGDLRWMSWDGVTGWAEAFAPVPTSFVTTDHVGAYLDPSGAPVLVSVSQPVPPSTEPLPAILLWSSGTWTDLGPSLAATQAAPLAGIPFLAWSASGVLHAAWVTRTVAKEARLNVSRWDGASWAQVGEPVLEGLLAIEVHGLAFSGADLYVLWSSRQNVDQIPRLGVARYTPL